MKLRKPPIVQAWIEFRFEPSPDHPWEEQPVMAFLETTAAEYDDPSREFIKSSEVHVRAGTGGAFPQFQLREATVAVRAFNVARTRWLEVWHNRLRCGLLRGGAGYEGFSALRANALAMLDSHASAFEPMSVISFVLHYEDAVDAPLTDGRLNLEDYFTLILKSPSKGLGTLAAFRTQFLRNVPGTGDFVEVVFRDDRNAASSEAARLMFDWEYIGGDIPTDRELFGERLDRAHATLLKCFRDSFTEAGWQLFEPEAEEDG